jgi:hypothetical protein
MHRAAVGVVGGVGDQLVVGGQRQRLVEGEGMVGFEDALAAVVERAAGRTGRCRRYQLMGLLRT